MPDRTSPAPSAPLPRPQVGVVWVVHYDPEAIAACTGRSVEQVIADYRDARNFSSMGEALAARIRDAKPAPHRNQRGYDLVRDTQRIEVKSLSDKVNFQNSQYVGSGRSGTDETLRASLATCDAYVVNDVAAFPAVRQVEIPTSALLAEAEAGRLAKSGQSRAAFYEMLERIFPRQIVHETTMGELMRADS